MEGCPWHVLIIEEMEQCVSNGARAELKFRLSEGEMLPRLILVCTDGKTDWPDKPTRPKVIAALTRQPSMPAPKWIELRPLPGESHARGRPRGVLGGRGSTARVRGNGSAVSARPGGLEQTPLPGCRRRLFCTMLEG